MSDRDALINGIANSGGDSTPSLVFADYLFENGIPGEHIVRAGASDRNALGLIQSLAPFTPYWRGVARVTSDPLAYVPDWKVMGYAHRSANPGPFLLSVHHGAPESERIQSIQHVVPVYSMRHVAHLMRDFPKAATKEILTMMRGHGLPKTDPRDEAPRRLARIGTETEDQLLRTHDKDPDDTPRLALADYEEEEGNQIPADRIRWWLGAKRYVEHHGPRIIRRSAVGSPLWYRRVYQPGSRMSRTAQIIKRVLPEWVYRAHISDALHRLQGKKSAPHELLAQHMMRTALGLHTPEHAASVLAEHFSARTEAWRHSYMTRTAKTPPNEYIYAAEPDSPSPHLPLSDIVYDYDNSRPAREHDRNINNEVGRMIALARYVKHNPPPTATLPEEAKKLARMRAPAGGIVVNNQMQPGGQFMPRVFARIRDVARRAFKLARVRVPGVQTHGTNERALEDARTYHEKYGQALGLQPFTTEPSQLSITPEQTARIIQAYEARKHDPADPETKAAYDAYKRETLQQFNHIVGRGLKVMRWNQPGQPYANSQAMREHVDRDHALYYFPTANGYDSADAATNPLLEQAPGQPPGVVYNDLFRAVHEYLGHAMHGHEFGPKGELRAWHEHAKLYSPLARRALTNETLGQTQWFFHGPHKDKPVNQRPFPEQRTALLPHGVEPPAKLARPGEGRVTLQPSRYPGPNHVHDIHDETGQKIGGIALIDKGDTLHVNYVGLRKNAHDLTGQSAANDLGPAHIRSGLRQLRGFYPNAKKITGLRVSGARRANLGENTDVTRKLDRGPARGLEDNPHQPPMSRPAILAGQDEGDNPLTLGQLRRIEDEHGLPPEKRLSRFVKQPLTAEGEDHPFTATVNHIAQFFDNLAAHKLGKGPVRKVLQDPNRQDNEKLVYLVNHMGHELKDLRETRSNGNEWYGESINQLDAALHRTMTGGHPSAMWGTIGPNGELEGKQDPAAHHPAMALFKALIAATSAGQNPIDNLNAAFRIWRAGAKANPEDPISALPLYNHAAKQELLDKLDKLWGQQVPPPPDDVRGKAKWYATWVWPHRKELIGEGTTGYSVLPARIIVHDDPNHPHHGTLVQTIANGRTINDPIGSKIARYTRGRVVNADLPMTDKAGGIKSKGWTVRGRAVAQKIEQIQRLVKHFSGPDKTPLQAYRDAVDWLFKKHQLKDMAPVLQDMGIKNLNTGFLDAKKDLLPGAFVLGPKFGPFFLNLHMNDPVTRAERGDYLTADKWWTRLWNRYVGRLVGKKGINESPAGKKERKLMLAVARRAAAKIGQPVAALQADLWYYEQQLWRMFGGESMKSYSFADASKNLPARLSRQGKPVRLSFLEAIPKEHK